MNKEFYDKYGKEFHCADCKYLEHCIKSEEPLLNSCREEFLSCKVSDLEAKLAESEKRILELQEDSIRDNQIYNEQLAEKEKEVEELNHKLNVEQPCLLMNYQDMVEKLKARIEQYNQDKISFAVEQLEKVKEYVDNNSEDNYGLNGSVFYVVDSDKLCKTIDNQIKQLKEMK